MSRYFGLVFLMALLTLVPYPSGKDEPEWTAWQAAEESRVNEALHNTSLPTEAEARGIDRLIRQLSSSSFAEREEATRRLEKVGDRAVTALRAAAGKGADLELRRRVEPLATNILTKDLPQRFGASIADVEKILPEGWSVMRTVSGSTPPDWWTDNPKAGFLVEARNGENVLQIWFLPLDWIGIRKTPNRASHRVYWQGILATDNYKTITFATDESLQACVQHLGKYGLSTPCLVNSGYDRALRIFAGKLDWADRQAAALVQKHCRSPGQFREALTSLNDLGVPARRLFLRAARAARGEDRSRYTSILGLIGGDEAIGLLCDIGTDLQVSAYERKYALLALERHKDIRIGPALHRALKQMPDGEGLDCVVKGLMHRHYKPAETDLLELFKQQDNTAYAKEALADALAAFRCKEAIPELRRRREQLQKDGKKHNHGFSYVDLALLRLTGSWGEPSEGARLFVRPPQQPRLGDKMKLTIHLENSGLEPIEIFPFPREMGLRVDGKNVFKEDNSIIVLGRLRRLDPGEVWTFTCDLTPYIKTPGRHEVQYVSQGGACSNKVAFTVRAGKP